MVSRLTALLLALIMGMPLCLCCTGAVAVAADGPAVVEESCPACRQSDSDAPATPAHRGDSHSERRCCAESNDRTLAPEMLAAPRPVLVDLQMPQWLVSDVLPRPVWIGLEVAHAKMTQLAPWHGPPLYQRNCALLL